MKPEDFQIMAEGRLLFSAQCVLTQAARKRVSFVSHGYLLSAVDTEMLAVWMRAAAEWQAAP